MIKVDRSRVETPSCLRLDDTDSPALKEQKKAITHFTKPGQTKGFDFNVYRRAEIKQAFRLLFFDKCAYCESRYAATQPVDVEHFRPKGNVRATPEETAAGISHEGPGYYWLAGTWENLLPSCIDCNRNRGQPVFVNRDGTRGDITIEANVGKADFFPVDPAQPRWISHSDTAPKEVPLLLNPCIDDPQEFFRYDDFGAVLPAPDLEENTTEFRKFSASCQIYGLNRLDLVHERRAVLLLLHERMRSIRMITELLQNRPGNLEDSQLILLQDLLAHELDALHRFSEPYQPFSLMASQAIETFLKNLTDEELRVTRKIRP